MLNFIFATLLSSLIGSYAFASSDPRCENFFNLEFPRRANLKTALIYLERFPPIIRNLNTRITEKLPSYLESLREAAAEFDNLYRELDYLSLMVRLGNSDPRVVQLQRFNDLRERLTQLQQEVGDKIEFRAEVEAVPSMAGRILKRIKEIEGKGDVHAKSFVALGSFRNKQFPEVAENVREFIASVEALKGTYYHILSETDETRMWRRFKKLQASMKKIERDVVLMGEKIEEIWIRRRTSAANP